jgi:hypothetical protein
VCVCVCVYIYIYIYNLFIYLRWLEFTANLLFTNSNFLKVRVNDETVRLTVLSKTQRIIGLLCSVLEYLALRGTKLQGNGRNYIMRSQMICTAHQILYG